MALKLITAATILPVSLIEAKAHLRVDVADDETLITAMIWAAAQGAEQVTGRALTAQTWELTLDEFPAVLELTRMPVASITSVKYIDTAGVLQTLDSALYALSVADDFGFATVTPIYGGSWPATRDQVNAVTLRYVAGYADAAGVPQSIKSWMLLQIGAMYENREAESSAQMHPLGFADRLLDRYRVYA